MEGSEFALTSALLAVLGSVVYYSWTAKPTSPRPEGSRVATPYTRPKGNVKRGKKRRTNETSSFVPASTDHDDSAMETSPSDAKPKYSKPSPATPRVVVQRSGEATIPGGLAPLLSASEMESTHSAGSSASKSAQKKKKKASKKEKPLESENERMPPGGLMLAPPPPVPNVSASKQKGSPQSYRHETSEASEFDSGREWTLVDKGKNRRARGGHMESASDTGVTTSVTEEEGSVASVSQPPSATRERGNTLTSAQKLLPKAAETKVDDMLEGPRPGIARVMRVTGTSSVEGTDAEGFGADGEEDPTWSIVPTKQRGGSGTPSNAASRQNTATAASGSNVQTKKQRQNEKKREAEKAAKELDEKDRSERLKQHRREQEKARIADAYKPSNKNTLSGGQQAKLDFNGKVIWD